MLEDRQELELGFKLEVCSLANIWNLGTPEFIYEFLKHMKSYMKKKKMPGRN